MSAWPPVIGFHSGGGSPGRPKVGRSGVSVVVRGVPAWFQVSVSPVSFRSVRDGLGPGNRPESRMCRPLRSDAWICSSLQAVDALQGSASRVAIHVAGPSVGLVEVITCPSWSTATHSDAEGQAIEVRSLPPSMVVLVQAPAVGLVEV